MKSFEEVVPRAHTHTDVCIHSVLNWNDKHVDMLDGYILRWNHVLAAPPSLFGCIAMKAFLIFPFFNWQSNREHRSCTPLLFLEFHGHELAVGLELFKIHVDYQCKADQDRPQIGWREEPLFKILLALKDMVSRQILSASRYSPWLWRLETAHGLSLGVCCWLRWGRQEDLGSRFCVPIFRSSRSMEFP